jgi:hypothetical protein
VITVDSTRHARRGAANDQNAVLVVTLDQLALCRG